MINNKKVIFLSKYYEVINSHKAKFRVKRTYCLKK